MKATLTSYQQAAVDIREKFAAMQIAASVSAARGGLDEDWPHIAFDVEFSKGRAVFKTTWRMGVGHVKTCNPDNDISIRMKLSEGGQSLLRAWHFNPGAKFKDKALQAQVAATLALVQKVSPDPSEVFARVCEEALEATETTFEDWAANFGYDADSRKAERIFNKCREPYPVLLAMCGSVESMRAIVELAREL